METVTINLGGEDHSIEFYFTNDDILTIYSIQDLYGREVYETLNDEIFEELMEILNRHYGK